MKEIYQWCTSLALMLSLVYKYLFDGAAAARSRRTVLLLYGNIFMLFTNRYNTIDDIEH